MTGRVFAVITGGGTAGHVLPALAIAEALVDAGHPADEIHYVGARRGIETSLLDRSPFPHTFLDVVGLQRGLSRHDLAVNVTMAPKLLAATREAIRLLRGLSPRVVVSVGTPASRRSSPPAASGRRSWPSATTAGPAGPPP
jgi:UDP-N-acetylglucosamine--N-acetylmuramyl-(pentapeptide) pyrophosphoryl-undecaprenol N-acetylglucosamine transferase